ncbi:zinc finger CCCH domain-containing protein 32-like [Zingiber officinale]|nr:zinc finger CCCH domain-containing protein 32-like [Zingiber officinale]XP_042395927.1 zinc finger CCCH domain-containing protein 32-like [Zingiber officinale]
MESDGGREPIRSAAAEEEVLKRKNTDCVYFLASPLTCKKGSECDYRHSEGARVNPRDCWYWLNGDCLNPKCSFRHPPLDFMFATPMANSGPTPPPSQTPASALTQAARTPNNSSKQSVPCYYFQWGQCLKGERCPFMHEPQPSINFVSQQLSAKSLTFSSESRQTNEKKAQNITKQQNVAEISFDNPKVFINKHVGVLPTTAKFVTKAGNVSRLELSENKTFQRSSDNDPPPLPQNGVVSDSYLQSQSWGQQVQHPDDKTDNGNKDADELLLEHSPGFDVLVDDDIEDPDYHDSEDNFRRVSAHGCQNMEAEDEYEYHQSDYETRAEIETDLHNDIGQYDNYGQLYSRYDRESKTSHRILERSPSLERRVFDRAIPPEMAMDGSDLRYQLMKRRRINDSRSTSNHGVHSQHYRKDEQERHYGRHARNNTKFTSEKSISSRLQGRIAFPGRTTSEQERGRRPQSRLSPVTRINYQSRDPERTRLLPSKEFSKDEKTRRNRIHLRDGTESLDFASPKSLSVLKGIKNNKNIHDTSSNLTLNNVKSKKVEGVYKSENPPFEGPLPLGAILKRKRESTYAENKLSTGLHENNQAGGGPAINESVPQLEARNGGSFTIGSPEEEEVIPTEDDLTYDAESPTKADAIETEDGMTLEHEEVEELENYDRQDGDFDYESGEYKVDDENTIQSDEADLDDDDDFARKISVMLS